MGAARRLNGSARKKLRVLRERVAEAQNWRCCYCGERSDALTLEHVVPLGSGGSNDWDNCVAACLDCNNRRDKMDAYQFATMRLDMIEQAQELAALIHAHRQKPIPRPVRATLADVWPQRAAA